MEAQEARGLVLSLALAGSPLAYVPIPAVRTVQLRTGAGAFVDTTTVEDPAGQRRPTLLDEGQCTFQLWFTPDEVVHEALVYARSAREQVYFTLDLPDGEPFSRFSFAGYVVSAPVSVPSGAVVAAQVVVEISGEVVYSRVSAAVCLPSPFYYCGPQVLGPLTTAPLYPVSFMGAAFVWDAGPTDRLIFIDNAVSSTSSAARIVWSEDYGATWTAGSIPTGQYYRIVRGNSRFVAGSGFGTSSNLVAVSDDGKTWTRGANMPSVQFWYAWASGDGKVVALAFNSAAIAVSSNDAASWAGSSQGSSNQWSALAYSSGANRWLAVARNTSATKWSVNGAVTWGAGPPLVGLTNASEVVYGGGKMIACTGTSSSEFISVLDDTASSWVGVRLPVDAPSSYGGLAYADGVWRLGIVGQPTVVLLSKDGYVWDKHTVPALNIAATRGFNTRIGTVRLNSSTTGIRQVYLADAPLPGRIVVLAHLDETAAPPLDSSCMRPKTLALTGAAALDQTVSKFGAGSVLVPNSGVSTLDGLQLANDPDLDFGQSDFSVVFWVQRLANTYAGYLLDIGTPTARSFILVGADGLVDLQLRSGNGTQTFNDVALFPLGGFVPVCFQRRDMYWELWINDELVVCTGIAGTSAANVRNASFNSAADWFFGRPAAASAQTLNGRIDEIVVTRDVVRNVSDQSTPAAPFADSPAGDPSFSKVVLLLHFDGPNGSTTFVDSSSYSRTLGRVAPAAISTARSRFGGSSFLPASGYATVPFATELNFRSRDFTIEGWALNTATTGIGTLLDFRGTSGAVNSSWAIGVDYGTRAVFIFDGVLGITTLSTNYSATPGVNTWYFWQIIRRNGVTRIHVDGRCLCAVLYNPPATHPSGLLIGDNLTGTASPHLGHIDELRMTIDVARTHPVVASTTLPICDQESE